MSFEPRASRLNSQLTARKLVAQKKMPPAGTRGLTTALLIRSLCWCEDRLLMTTVVLVAIDLARLAVLLAVHLGALLRG